MEQTYFTGSMPLLSTNHSSKTCGGPEAFTSTTNIKDCGVKTSLEVETKGNNILRIERSMNRAMCRIQLKDINT